MRIISKRALEIFWAKHPAAEGPLSKWHSAVKHAEWGCFDDVRQTYNSADQVKDFVVFNVNSYRVVATIRYRGGRVYLAHVFTHTEYDKWKK